MNNGEPVQHTAISLVIPAFNETDSIHSVLSELETYMRGFRKGPDWEIIVVNDGSTDATMSILNTISRELPWLKVVDLVTHQGRGKALRTGFEHAQGNIIVSLDADLSYSPYHIERMVDAMHRENADIVLASAYGREGTARNVPFKRLWLSMLGNKVLAYMFGGDISVLTCLVRAYRRDFLERLDLHSNDKEIHLEILYKTRMVGGRIVEVPADLCWRAQKLSRAREGTNTVRRSTLKIKKTSSSHLFFALMNKPGIIFWIPGYLLILISLLIFIMTTSSILFSLSDTLSLYQGIRQSMLHATPSWLTMVISFVLGIQFFTLGFITNQTKRNYENTYRTLNSIYKELKK